MAYVGRFREGWRVQLQRDGIRVSKTFDTKREAQVWANEQEGKKTLARGNTLRQACDHYLQTVSPGKRDAVLWESRRFLAFCAYFGDHQPLAEIDSAALGRFRDFRLVGDAQHRPVSGSTVLREFNLYRNLFKLAFDEWKMIPEYPFKGVRLPKENSARVALWRWLDIRRVLRAGQRSGGKTLEVTQAFHISLRTSLRLKEALAAPGGFDGRTITIPPSKTDPLPSVIPTTRLGRRLLQTIPKLIVGPNEASTLFSDLCAQLGISGVQYRDSRATALTLMARHMEILTLQKFSRHKDIRELSGYYRESAEDISARH